MTAVHNHDIACSSMSASLFMNGKLRNTQQAGNHYANMMEGFSLYRCPFATPVEIIVVRCRKKEMLKCSHCQRVSKSKPAKGVSVRKVIPNLT